MNASVLLLAMSLVTASAGDDAKFGAVAMAPLPRGSLAVYGMGGYPELRAGFRQGLSGLEFTGEAGIDYLRAKGWGMGGMRAPLLEQESLRLALDVRFGGFGDAGARYADSQNTRSAGLMAELGSVLTLKTSWPLAWIAFARVPMEMPLTSEGISRMTVLVGGGAEVAVGRDYYVLFSGGSGVEIRRPATGSTDARLAVEAMVGVGYRIF